MPCDINTRENIDDYENVLAEISAICRNNDAMYICIAGDFNTAFDREQSWHTLSLKQFMSQENIMCGVDFTQSRVDYSYCNSSNNSYSVIYHFVMSEPLFCDIVDYYSICDEIDNQSDHAPIIMSLKYNIERKTIPHKFEERICWRKSGLNDIDTYKLNFDFILSTLNVPFDCINCDDCFMYKH